MFQMELAYRMREEQFKDYVREAEEHRRKAKKRRQGSYGVARLLVVAPLALVALVGRIISSYSHSLRP